ncbi:probable tubulin polyglutamylase ttll-15 [Polistes fuscatus]|uniref:probable tubulin polyglutamylase ttll-15 n=1 Tax=Polistes fuscatus TaxID=30207 RepID=UPI001CA7B80E|nr:probable tubulin polyglutamylase ttll-15 [Polistes fuscatus]XP_043485455.1 probable tubulin polyglutamylase ttll-15 [Polistes fuscatus]
MLTLNKMCSNGDIKSNFNIDTNFITTDTKKMRRKRKQEMEQINIFNKLQLTFKLFVWFMSSVVVFISIFYYLYIQSPLKKFDKERIDDERPTYYVLNRNNDSIDHLKNIFTVLNGIGFRRTYDEANWNLLWSHEYPFLTLAPILQNLKPHQLINHFPGCGYITNKKHLSTSGVFYYLPQSFKIPQDKDRFLSHTVLNPNKLWLKKSNNHRGIKIVKASDIDYNDSESFIQDFIDNPFLIDGYKFDLGVYVVFTSIDPLRVYIYKGDVLLRFCTIKYEPFDSSQEDSYIIGDEYRPIWEVPSLNDYYIRLGYSMKDSLYAYMRSIGKDFDNIWNQINKAIQEIAIMKESLMKESIQRYGNRRNYFELVRFDFIIDKDMKVHVMEANMSPNLSSAHYPPNQLLYEQVLFNLFSLIGINPRVKQTRVEKSSETRGQLVHEMEVASKNLAVLPHICTTCHDCLKMECQLCIPCMTEETKHILIQSYKEHQNKLDFQRIFPPSPLSQIVLNEYSLQNQLLIKWYQGKCANDPLWCMS